MDEKKTKKSKGGKKTKKQEEKPVEEFYVNGQGITSCCKECHIKRMVEGRKRGKEIKKALNDIENAKNMRLADFTPRQLMEELKRRGYQGKLTYVETHTIDLSTL